MHHVYGIDYPIVIPDVNSYSLRTAQKPKKKKENYSMYVNSLTVIPNPFNEFTSVFTYIEDGENAEITVTDVVGKKINSYTLSSGWNEVKITGDELQNGIYFCTLKLNGSNQQIQKIVCTK